MYRSRIRREGNQLKKLIAIIVVGRTRLRDLLLAHERICMLVKALLQKLKKNRYENYHGNFCG
jgi:hypothetical protein